MPVSPDDMRAYAPLIRQDFASYMTAVEDYLRCVDDERAAVFREARAVTADYGEFLRVHE